MIAALTYPFRHPEAILRNGHIILSVFYFFGILGMISPWRDSFVPLTPLILLFSFIILLGNHSEFDRSWIVRLLLIVLIGFLIEVIGVNTGFPFGNYSYGENLGFKLAGTPLIIGINWCMLIYSLTVLLPETVPNWLAAAFGATGMVIYDFLLEPVAISLNLWTWEAASIPAENYLSWFVISFLMILFLRTASRIKSNEMALPLLGIQVGFYTALNILL